jgi:NADH/NAD ratio-sensing transcriptional regulator Rex
VEDACNKVSTLIGLRSNRDFRLFHEIGKKELRVLDHEHFLTKIFEFPKQQHVIIVGFVETIKSTLQKIVSPKTLPTLVFKKYYYLPYEIEQS